MPSFLSVGAPTECLFAVRHSASLRRQSSADRLFSRRTIRKYSQLLDRISDGVLVSRRPDSPIRLAQHLVSRTVLKSSITLCFSHRTAGSSRDPRQMVCEPAFFMANDNQPGQPARLCFCESAVALTSAEMKLPTLHWRPSTSFLATVAPQAPTAFRRRKPKRET